MSDATVPFSFGKNWEDFIRRKFTTEIVGKSQRHLLDFLELPDLRGRGFLDVGCGSGLHSLAALEARAERIVSFDADPSSVRTAERIRAMRGNPPSWRILRGSILDRAFIAAIEPEDIVYSWGVLHHTGKMWEAIENAAGLMKGDGLLYIALYTTDARSDHWLEVKKKYNAASAVKKRIMELSYVMRYTIAPCLLARETFQRTMRSYRQRNRGMSYLTDVRDWLGGYPFEHAKIEEVLGFCRKRLGLELVNIKTGEANTEYLFKRR